MGAPNALDFLASVPYAALQFQQSEYRERRYAACHQSAGATLVHLVPSADVALLLAEAGAGFCLLLELQVLCFAFRLVPFFWRGLRRYEPARPGGSASADVFSVCAVVVQYTGLSPGNARHVFLSRMAVCNRLRWVRSLADCHRHSVPHYRDREFYLLLLSPLSDSTNLPGG